VGLFEAFYSPPEPIIWMKRVAELARSSHFNPGRNKFQFELALAPTSSRDLIETLKGVSIRTTYVVRVVVNRGLTSRTLSTECELYVQVPNVQLQRALTPPTQFKIADTLVGEIQSLSTLGTPLSGQITAKRRLAEASVLSVDIELNRIEDIFWGEDALREVHLIHTQQIIDGPIKEHTVVPFFFIIPRLIISPSFACTEFQVSYCVRVVVTYKDEDPEERNVMVTFIR
jgi:hypothetical protein